MKLIKHTEILLHHKSTYWAILGSVRCLVVNSVELLNSPGLEPSVGLVWHLPKRLDKTDAYTRQCYITGMKCWCRTGDAYGDIRRHVLNDSDGDIFAYLKDWYFNETGLVD